MGCMTVAASRTVAAKTGDRVGPVRWTGRFVSWAQSVGIWICPCVVGGSVGGVLLLGMSVEGVRFADPKVYEYCLFSRGGCWYGVGQRDSQALSVWSHRGSVESDVPACVRFLSLLVRPAPYAGDCADSSIQVSVRLSHVAHAHSHSYAQCFTGIVLSDFV